MHILITSSTSSSPSCILCFLVKADKGQRKCLDELIHQQWMNGIWNENVRCSFTENGWKVDETLGPSPCVHSLFSACVSILPRWPLRDGKHLKCTWLVASELHTWVYYPLQLCRYVLRFLICWNSFGSTDVYVYACAVVRVEIAKDHILAISVAVIQWPSDWRG